jgi:NAD(P)-dependent dehydrogenase (short-subunit alcohol dehydrogenase family)
VSRRLERQRILLTGGGSGIGRAVALAYLANGASVTVLERSPDHARELAEVGGSDLDVLVGDATDTATLAEAVERASGDQGLDNLTSCVGVFDYYASLRTLSAAELVSAADEIYRVNVRGTLSAVHAALPALQRTGGSVTLTVSESAFHPVGGGVLYGSSKWALRGVVSHLAADLAPEVRVNGVAPGGTTGTRFGGLSTLGQTQTADRVEGRDQRIAAGTLLGVTPRPEDHAGAYVYLADRTAAGIVNAVVINTDGGRRP